MKQPWTLERTRTAVISAEQQIEHVITTSLMQNPSQSTMNEASYRTVHGLVVNLITLFRDQVADAATATQIARAYAACVAGAAKLPSVNCIQKVLDVVQMARERRLPA